MLGRHCALGCTLLLLLLSLLLSFSAFRVLWFVCFLVLGIFFSVCFACIPSVYSALGSQRRISDLLKVESADGCDPPCKYKKPNQGLLQDNQVLLLTELSVQPHSMITSKAGYVRTLIIPDYPDSQCWLALCTVVLDSVSMYLWLSLKQRSTCLCLPVCGATLGL